MLIKDLPEPIRKLVEQRRYEYYKKHGILDLYNEKLKCESVDEFNFDVVKEGFDFWYQISNGNFTPYYAMYGLPEKWCIKCLPEWVEKLEIINKDWERCVKSMFDSNNGLSLNYYYHNHTAGAISIVLEGVTEITLSDWIAANPEKKEDAELNKIYNLEGFVKLENKECVIPEELNKMKSPQFDPINKPKHYNSHPSGIECIEITQHHDFCTGNAIKYLWRQGLKDGENSVTDLKKAVWYIERKIKQIENSGK